MEILTVEEIEELRARGLNNLMIACIAGNLEEVETLLENQEENPVNFFSQAVNYPPLVYALKANNKNLVVLLLRKGADVNINCSLLDYEGMEDDLGYRINNFPTVSFETEQLGTHTTWTPLMFAGKYCEQDTVDLLLDKNAELVAQGDHYIISIHKFYAWQTPFLYNKVQLGKYLLQKTQKAYDLDDTDIDVLFIQCLLLKQYDSMKYLLEEECADINFDLIKHRRETECELMFNTGLCYTVVEKVDYDPQLVDFMLANGANINNIDNEYGFSALAWASKHGYIDIVDKILSHPATEDNILNIDAPYIQGKVIPFQMNDDDDDGFPFIRTALMHASEYGYIDIVKKLLVRGASVNLIDNKGETALIKASREGHIEIVEILLANQADVNIQDNQRRTALMYAIDNNHKADIFDEFLRPHGTSITLRDINDDNYLASEGHIEIVKTLLANQANVNIQDNQGETPLIKASREGHIEIVEILLASQADVNIQDNQRRTALMYAIDNNRTDVFDKLLQHGASITLRDINDDNSLAIALQNGFTCIIDKLLSSNKLNEENIALNCNRWGRNAFMIACEQGRLECLDRLLLSQCGSNINQKDIYGNTALILACQNKHLHIVQRLIDNAVDLSAVNSQGFSAIQRAYLVDNNSDVQNLLLERSQVDEKIFHQQIALLRQKLNPLMVACCQNDADLVKKLLEETDVSVDSFDNKINYPPLIYACKTNNIDIVKLLLLHNAQINQKCSLIKSEEKNYFPDIDWTYNELVEDKSNGWTAFMFACKYSSDEIIQLLLEHGADLNARAVHYCCTIDDFSAWQLPYYYDRADIGENLRQANHNEQNQISIDKLLSDCIYLKKKNSITTLIQKAKANIEPSIQNMVDINEEDDRVHPLFYAIETFDADFFNFLLKHGADINYCQDYDTPLSKATELGNLEIVNLLLENKPILKDYKEIINDAFMVACQYGHIHIFNRLVQPDISDELGNMIQLRDPIGQTGFIVSCQYGQLELLQMLLRRYTPKDIALVTDENGETALMKACQYGHIEVIDCLLSHLKDAIDVNQTDVNGQTALMKASYNGQHNLAPEVICNDKYAQIVQKLMKLGANINAIDSFGDTALMIACRQSGIKIVRQLLSDPRINLTIKNLKNETAASIAENNIKLLLDSPPYGFSKSPRARFFSPNEGETFTFNNIVYRSSPPQ